MPYDPATHHRRSIRLHGFDYSSAGAYFVTLCLQHHDCLLGEIVEGGMKLNGAGRMVKAAWEVLPERHQIAQLDEFAVMPNHFHGILFFTNGRGEPCVRPLPFGDNYCNGNQDIRPHGTAENSLGRVIQTFKSFTTHAYVEGVKQRGWPRFRGTLWQRNYYERVIRNEEELTRDREYILNNPLKWDLDPENPVCHR